MLPSKASIAPRILLLLRIFVLRAFPNYSATSLINKDKGMEEDKKVVEFLSKQKHVKLAYLFGSVAEGRKGKERKAERCGSGSFSG
jgi:hypothetical protein